MDGGSTCVLDVSSAEGWAVGRRRSLLGCLLPAELAEEGGGSKVLERARASAEMSVRETSSHDAALRSSMAAQVLLRWDLWVVYSAFASGLPSKKRLRRYSAWSWRRLCLRERVIRGEDGKGKDVLSDEEDRGS